MQRWLVAILSASVQRLEFELKKRRISRPRDTQTVCNIEEKLEQKPYFHLDSFHQIGYIL